jgi:hypothetical protein
MSENETPVDGVWIVSQSSGEAYESGYSSPVGAFATEELADAYIAAYNSADRVVLMSDNRTTNWHSWQKNFVPSVTTTPAIVTVYEQETVRDEDTGQRELSNVAVHYVDLNKVGTESSFGKAVHNRERAYQEVVESDGSVTVLDSETFPAMVLADTKDYYEGGYETFYTVDPRNIILDPPADYVHPEPIPWKPQVKGKDGLYDWERELLTGSTEEQEPTEAPLEEPKPKVPPLEEWELELLRGD